jgi:hypothetical protein
VDVADHIGPVLSRPARRRITEEQLSGNHQRGRSVQFKGRDSAEVLRFARCVVLIGQQSGATTATKTVGGRPSGRSGGIREQSWRPSIAQAVLGRWDGPAGARRRFRKEENSRVITRV